MREISSSERSGMTLEALLEQAESLDQAALATPDIDAFCSSTAWVFPALRAFQPATKPMILRPDEGYVLLTRINDWQGRFLVPFEASWCLGCPLLGANAEPLVHALWKHLRVFREWDVLLLTGLTPRNQAWRQILRHFSRENLIFPGPASLRRVIDLEGDLEKYLGRRSPKFRKTLRQSVRNAQERGFDFLRISGVLSSSKAEALLQRCLKIESRSWKGLALEGINESAMRQFYGEMFQILGPTGSLRVILVQDGEKEIGYLFGAIFGNGFRGLQFSFDQEYRACGIGNLMQYQMLRWMAEEQCELYDLGMDMPYKQRWSDRCHATASLAIRRR